VCNPSPSWHAGVASARGRVDAGRPSMLLPSCRPALTPCGRPAHSSDSSFLESSAFFFGQSRA
jgi:hypothetical protein